MLLVLQSCQTWLCRGQTAYLLMPMTKWASASQVTTIRRKVDISSIAVRECGAVPVLRAYGQRQHKCEQASPADSASLLRNWNPLQQTGLSLPQPSVLARLDGRRKPMTSSCDEIQCLGKRASDASICSEDVKVEDLPLHQEPEEAYVDFGSRFTRTPEGRPLVVLRAELLTDKEGRVSSAAASE